MERDFSFLELFKYGLRKWFILVLATVVGGGALFVYWIASSNENVAQQNGSITIGNFDVFYPDVPETESAMDNLLQSYNSLFNRAIDVMTAAELRNKVFNQTIIDPLKEGEQPKLTEKEFNASLQISRTGIGLNVVFKYDDLTEEDDKFSRNIVNVYMDMAIKAAKIDRPSLETAAGAAPKIFKNEVYKSDDLDVLKKSRGLLTNLALGCVGGIVIGLVITMILYFADRRVKSHADVLGFVGDRVFWADKGISNENVCPKIDSVLTEKKLRSLLITNVDKEDSFLAKSYADYCSGAGYKTLVIDFGGGSGLKDYFANGTLLPLDKGKTTISADISDAGTILANRKKFDELISKYDRICLSADYCADGQLAPLGVLSDAVVTVINQPTVQRGDVVAMIYEIGFIEKGIGAVINNTSKSYVGKIIN